MTLQHYHNAACDMNMAVFYLLWPSKFKVKAIFAVLGGGKKEGRKGGRRGKYVPAIRRNT